MPLPDLSWWAAHAEEGSGGVFGTHSAFTISLHPTLSYVPRVS